MNRPYPPEPVTHYDGEGGHGYNMHDVLDPPELNELVADMERSNVVYIKGERYILTWWSDPQPDGHLDARLRPEEMPF